MEPPPKPTSTSLFQVYLRLRPSQSLSTQTSQPSLYPQLPQPTQPERFLTVEEPSIAREDVAPTHITVHPLNDSRKRAVEKFAFTRVFEEDATQLDIFKGTGAIALIEGVLGERRDGLLATLGVTGSGKSHTILGSKTQRGLTQLSLDLLFRSLSDQLADPASSASLITSLNAADACEASIVPASNFLDGIYGDISQERGISRAPTPVTVGQESSLSIKPARSEGLWSQWSILDLSPALSPRGTGSRNIHLPPNAALSSQNLLQAEGTTLKRQKPPQSPSKVISSINRAKAKFGFGTSQDYNTAGSPRKNVPKRPSALRLLPNIEDITLPPTCPISEYAVLVSMYEVYNDRIFDLLCHPRNLKDLRRRPLLFKSTEASPDRKVVAGLQKVVCGSYDDALMVLETGLTERRVAGTGSNSVSSRSHGFFCVEVKKRTRGEDSESWSGAQLTIVDLAGSERARNAKTAGATLAEAGKINESLMYLGQCLQMQSDFHEGSKPSIVPFRQCKLTELLFSNSFPSASHHASSQANSHNHHRNPQKAVMIVTADPLGDFNATSQILRYSALAREVTVPRIPSVSSTILSGLTPSLGSGKFFSACSGRTTPNDNSAELDVAVVEILKLTEELDLMRMRLSAEQERRREAVEGWRQAEERAQEMERDIREDVCNEMEEKVEEERRRWMDAFEEEGIRKEEHLDRKLDLLSKHLTSEGNVSKARVEALEDENDTLRHQLHLLERELHSKTPSSRPRRKKDLSSSFANIIDDQRGDEMGMEMGLGLEKALSGLRDGNGNGNGGEGKGLAGKGVGVVKVGKTPRKVRKLTGKKTFFGDENSLESL